MYIIKYIETFIKLNYMSNFIIENEWISLKIRDRMCVNFVNEFLRTPSTSVVRVMKYVFSDSRWRQWPSIDRQTSPCSLIGRDWNSNFRGFRHILDDVKPIFKHFFMPFFVIIMETCILQYFKKKYKVFMFAAKIEILWALLFCNKCIH